MEPPAPPPRPKTVDLYVSAADRESYRVSIDGGGFDSESCSPPCILHVVPGPATLRVRGSRSYEQEITIPEGGSRVTLESACCLVAAAVLLGLGVPADIAAIAYASKVPSCDPYTGLDYSLCQKDQNRLTAFTVGFGLTGVTLTIIGLVDLGRGLARGGTRAVMKESRSRPRLVGVAVMALPTVQGGSVAFSF